MRSWRAWLRALSDQDMVNVAAYFAAQTPKPGYAHNKNTVPLGREDLSRRHCRTGRAGVRELPRAHRSGHPGAVSASVGAVGGLHGGAVDRVHAGPGRTQQQRRRCMPLRRGCRIAKSRLWPITSRACIKKSARKCNRPGEAGKNKKRVMASCASCVATAVHPFLLFSRSVNERHHVGYCSRSRASGTMRQRHRSY